nr:helix-turn-helix transcriptional regulator [Diplocloster agilis]
MEPISQQDVAGELGIHYAYLSKIFREDTGCNFTEYLNRIRIEKAKQLIAAQEYKIKEIYSMVGYNQYNYFFKVFKQQTGCTPSDYEEQILKK